MERIDAGVVPLDDDHPIEIIADGKEAYTIRKTWKEFRDWFKYQKPFIHVVCLVELPGAELFGNELERRYYWPPGSPRNDLFLLHAAVFGEQRWQVVSIPAKHERFAERVADKLGLVLMKKAPVFWELSDKEIVISSCSRYDETPPHGGKWFPLRGPSTRTLMIDLDGTLGRATEAGLAPVIKNLEHLIVGRNEASAKNAPRDN